MPHPDERAPDFILRTDVEPDAGEKRFVVSAEFENRGRVVLARVGEGEGDFRTAETLRASAQAIADELEQCHLRGWYLATGVEDCIGILSIDYDREDRDPTTSYRGVMLSSGGKLFQQVNTGDPAVDWKAANVLCRRSFGKVMTSSSVDRFCHDVSGYRWSETGELVAETPDAAGTFRRSLWTVPPRSGPGI